jgi:hypothetical protein
MKNVHCNHGDETCLSKIKILIIVLLIFIFGCGIIQTHNQKTASEITQTSNNKTMRNPKCEEVKSFRVFQVLDSFVLANVCKDDDDGLCLGHTVYFYKEKGKIYFDDQRIKVKDNECAIYTGTYQYQTNDGRRRTVPIVKIIDSQIQNSK